VDLEFNFSILPEQGELIAPVLMPLLRPASLQHVLRPIAAAATPQARRIAASFLAHGQWAPDAAGILFTGNGRQAIAASLAALASPGDRIGVEALTYPVVKGIAARLGLTLVPLALDAEGVKPDALARVHRAAPLRAVYLQPCLHNPLGLVMSRKRRDELATLLARHDLIAIEDTVYSFLAEETPLAFSAPSHVILVDSLSKRVAPGLTLGFVAAPAGLSDRIAAAIRSGGWSAPGFALAAGLQLMSEGTAARLAAAKRRDAAQRRSLARAHLAPLAVSGDARAYHLWLTLPEAWRAEAFAAAAARHGIAVTPASAFTVNAGHAPNAVRLALASPPGDVLKDALQVLRRVALAGPEQGAVE
jgi:DNA-binding transcriptional MocR family regulator